MMVTYQTSPQGLKVVGPWVYGDRPSAYPFWEQCADTSMLSLQSFRIDQLYIGSNPSFAILRCGFDHCPPILIRNYAKI